KSGVTDKYHLFIVVESVDDVYFLAKETGMIKSITLGGVKSRENTTQISKAVFVT
ncbi:MAG: PTS sugar transporter subunit IIB, partial [Lachnospiraceae bacterium]|nr:PTS sugar transporter subunit IIB [Lachnospiraceae bacterium]